MAPLPELVSPTVEAIYKHYESLPREERTYLGASTIGAECERQLWYGFHLISPPEQLDGRKIRLFQTGHREEARLIEDLRNAGVEVWETNPETGEQWSVECADGHCRGHLDGVLMGIIEAPKTAHVFEAKTHGAKSFKALLKDGVAVSKPIHMAQMQLYAHLMGITRMFYMAVEKDTDQIHVERIEYDAALALRLVAKAERVVKSATPLPKLHEDPSSKMAFACGWCPHKGVCHEGQWARTTCRSCLYSTPIPGGQWHCARWDKLLTLDEQRASCPAHLFIPSLVPGSQEDCDEAAGTVTYRLKDGSIWKDGG